MNLIKTHSTTNAAYLRRHQKQIAQSDTHTHMHRHTQSEAGAHIRFLYGLSNLKATNTCALFNIDTCGILTNAHALKLNEIHGICACELWASVCMCVCMNGVKWLALHSDSVWMMVAVTSRSLKIALFHSFSRALSLRLFQNS